VTERRPAAPVSAERWRTIDAIFADAVERPAAERPAFIANACGSDADLRAEVESLLAAYESDADFLETPPVAPGGDGPALAGRLQTALGGAFRVEREIGGGGMSRVFVAEETRLGRRVVVKVLPPELRAGLSIERFHRETRLAAALRHPHIVPLLTAGESEDGLVYFTMPYIEGESLRQRLEREGRLELAQVAAIVREVADALAYAHANGVIHRDIKPANVLSDGGHVVVADFGVAKALALAAGEPERPERPIGAEDSENALTVVGSAIGTPGYMSLEQARAGDVDARSDVYSLGCMTFEMLTGQLPFGTAGVYGIADPEVEPPPLASAHCPGLPPAVDGVLARALALDVHDRFQSTTAFAQALSAAATPALGIPEVVVPRPVWRRPWVAAASVVAVVSVAIGIVELRRAATGALSGSAMPIPASGPALAVLPFANVGAADDAYFAAGVSDELASRLTSIAGVRVMSPGSTRQYRNTTKPRNEVARELGVDYLLDGHVRWDRSDSAARRVRVTVELVRTRDGSSVWADHYDARTEDLFDVEGQIGERVAAALEVALGARERKSISARPTENFEAYSYYLRGEALRSAEEDAVHNTPRAIEMFERAVALDPKFALAYARLAKAHSSLYGANTDRTAKRLDLMRSAAETAVRLDPELPEAHIALGFYYFLGPRDFDRALAEYAIAAAQQPGSSELYANRGNLLRRMGRLGEAVANLERASELDPRSAGISFGVANIYGAMRNYADALRYADRTLALNPRWTGVYADRASFILNATGDLAAARRSLRDGMALPDAGKIIDRLRFQSGLYFGYTARDSAVLRSLTPDLFRGDTAQLMVWTADWARRHGQRERMRAYADSGRTMLERHVAAEPKEAFMHMQLAIAYALLDRKSDALREATRSTEITPVSQDGIDGADLQQDYAFVETLVGETDAAVKRLGYLLTIPSDVTLNVLRSDPTWDPLRGNPGFQRLIRG
jgi:serine/threonine-protein kinase